MLFLAPTIQNIMNLLMGVAGFAFVIAFHEFGHFIFARLFGVSVPTFSIGMGPVLWKKKIGQTDFSLSALPIGGYVHIANDHDDAKNVPASALLKNKPYYQKLLIMLGGIAFNLLFAYIALIAIFSIGTSGPSPVALIDSAPIINTISTSSPAQKAKLQPNDQIISVNSVVTSSIKLMLKELSKHANEKITINITRNNKSINVPIQMDSSARIGITLASPPIPAHSIGQAISKGIQATNGLIKQSAKGLIGLFKSRSMRGVGGPVMILSQTMKGAQKGFLILLFLLAYISIQLALLNLIPLPILDGGQILFHTIEAIIRRPLAYKAKLYVFIASWIFMITLFAALTVKDIWGLIGGLPIIKNLLGY
jgi:regulator of sigma E protease